MMRYVITVILALMMATGCGAQRKRALLVGISNYDKARTQWNSIHGANDVAMMRVALRKQGFSDITELRNGDATFKAICSALDRLIVETAAGDMVYVHMSGHGQPVEDYDGDEKGKDGWDESFVPYDAPRVYRKGVYEGERHLTDDIINGYVERMRLRCGSEGMVLVSIDACHAGDSYRGDDTEDSISADRVGYSMSADDAKYIIAAGTLIDEMPEWSTVSRGSAEGFSRSGKAYSASNVTVSEMNIIKQIRKKADVVIMESCLSTQRSYELKLQLKGRDFFCGPLSYVIYKVLMDGKTNLTKDAGWVMRMKDEYRKVLPKNNPQKLVIETSVWMK